MSNDKESNQDQQPEQEKPELTADIVEQEAGAEPHEGSDEPVDAVDDEPGEESDSADSAAPAPYHEESVATAPAAKGWGVAALVIAVIALLLAVSVAGLGHYRAQQIDQRVETLPPALERNTGRIADNQQKADTLAQNLEQQAAESQRQDRVPEEAIGALREQLGRDQGGWILAEAEYLLLVANHRLRLGRDADTALAALTLADERLREIGDPALIDIREAIANETGALKTLSRPDLPGLALALLGLANQVDKLPLQNSYLPVAPSKSPQEKGTQQVDDWGQLAGAVWGDLKGLVTVRRREEAARPMLAPEQQYFLRQNLRLQLESARLALLRSDQQQLHMALQAAREWIPQFFDDRAAATQGVLAELERIAAIEIRPALPDISGSLNALRAHMRQAAKQE